MVSCKGSTATPNNFYIDHASTEALWKHAGLHYFVFHVFDEQVLNVQQVVLD